MPTIATDKVCFIAIMAREVHAKVPPFEENPASDDAMYQELRDYLVALDVDERVELLALMWTGRGDFDASEWDDAMAEARATADAREPAYLIGTPLLSDYLEEGLAAFGLGCTDFEKRDL